MPLIVIDRSDRSIHHVHHHYREDPTVTELQQELAQLKTITTTTITHLQEQVKTLQGAYAELEAKYKAEVPSAEDTAELAALGKLIAAADPTSPETLPATPEPSPAPAAQATESAKS